MTTRDKVVETTIAGELARVGRPRATVSRRSNGIIAVADADGTWEGPAAVVLGALLALNNGAELWSALAART
jgi:hypothetical protein